MSISDLNIDLNTIKVLLAIIAFLITIVGYFVKKEIAGFGRRIDKHDNILYDLAGTVQRLIGYYEATKNHLNISEDELLKPPNSSGIERRKHPRN